MVHTYIHISQFTYIPPVQPVIAEKERRLHGRRGGCIAPLLPSSSTTTAFSPQPLKVPILQVENLNLAAGVVLAREFVGRFVLILLRRSIPAVDGIQVFTYGTHGFVVFIRINTLNYRQNSTSAAADFFLRWSKGATKKCVRKVVDQAPRGQNKLNASKRRIFRVRTPPSRSKLMYLISRDEHKQSFRLIENEVSD